LDFHQLVIAHTGRTISWGKAPGQYKAGFQPANILLAYLWRCHIRIKLNEPV